MPAKAHSRNQVSPESSRGSDPLQLLTVCGTTALVVARMLTPTESSVFGETLWISQLWLLVGISALWVNWRSGPLVWRVSRMDLAVLLLVAGHVISGANALLNASHPRMTWNMLFEWLALGASWFCLRILRADALATRRLDAIVMLVAAVLAGLGIWQHYVWYPQNAGKYLQTVAQLQRLESSTDNSPAQALEMNQLRQTLASMGMPEDETERLLWENRLVASSEPFGPHALANTFAGLLAAWTLIWLGIRWAAGRDGRWKRWQRHLVTLVLLGTLQCLILTKSRTAWLALLVVAGSALLWSACRRTVRIERFRPSMVIALTIAILLLLTFSTSLDWEVLTEAPKSLQYRWEYWTGAVAVIQEHPLAGVGAGNFRYHYLQHKLAGSSEEIADPHNLMLDVWANGGLLASIGLVLLITIVARQTGSPARRLFDSPGGEPEGEGEPVSDAVIVRPMDSWVTGAMLGFAAVGAARWMWGEDLTVWLCLFLFWLASVFVVSLYVRLASSEVALIVRQLATAVILLHLLGAGGIGMPAVTQFLLLLIVPWADGGYWSIRQRPAWVIAGTLLLGVLAVGCFTMGLRPVMLRSAMVSLGDSAWRDGRLPAAAAYYERAAEADPQDPEPLKRRAAIEYRQWLASPVRADPQFDAAVEWMHKAIALMPLSAFDYSRLGDWFLQRFRSRPDPANAEQALTYYRQAVERYPEHAGLQARLALAAALSGERELAETYAESALSLDRMAESRGHRDKRLPESQQQQLQRMVDGGGVLQSEPVFPDEP